MNIKRITKHWLFVPAMGAVLTLGCGLLLHAIRQGEWWENKSYDIVTHFGTYQNTNLILVMMDNYSYRQLEQERGKRWDRKLHAKLLNKLADDESGLVILDIIFGAATNTNPADVELSNAIRRQGHVVLWQNLELSSRKPESADNQPIPPPELFASAAAGVGIGHADTNNTVRRHWPFPSPYSDPEKFSLPWKVAVMSGKQLPMTLQKRWLRYYGENAGCRKISYVEALNEPAGFFRNKMVWIGNEPKNDNPELREDDKFGSPYGYAVGGVEILATTYLNLVRGDWLRRPSGWLEVTMLVSFGIVLGAGLTFLRRWIACVAAVLVFLAVMLTAVFISYYTNYWFSWLTLAGGQLPCALAWTWFAAPMRRRKARRDETMVLDFADDAAPRVDRPYTPDYELADEPFGKGAYGRVWLAKNAIGQWQALKAVYIAGFQNRTDPYDREFNGITRYKPVSEQHAGLLRIDFISQKKPEGYFYYIMELGDSLNPGWEKDPSLYKPKDLATVRYQVEENRLPIAECIRICLELCDALEFLHGQGLTHRDIKPQNIIFVRNRPKLADVGLIAEIRNNPMEGTWVGTPGYMPPLPEPPGTAQADIYGLGMVLYVIWTGSEPGFFSEITATFEKQAKEQQFSPLKNVVLKACQKDIAKRYASAAEMREGLHEAQRALTAPPGKTINLNLPDDAPHHRPDAPDYELVGKPFGSGASGSVWLAKNAIGQWQALKTVYLSERKGLYEREFSGLSRYKPVSEKHAGLLRIEFISQKRPEGYFYYVMELGDSLTAGWEKNPTLYKAKDLDSLRKTAEGNRLPVAECISIGLALCDALHYLHSQDLTHRDIKPQNVIFVGGQPKFADVGLMAKIRTNPMEGSRVGTPGYMPPFEPPGTAAADIYGLGMVLYVIATGREPGFYPEVATTLAEEGKVEQFLPLNKLILKACQSDINQRFASAEEMRDALREVQRALEGS